jgi:hypothetical protein
MGTVVELDGWRRDHPGREVSPGEPGAASSGSAVAGTGEPATWRSEVVVRRLSPWPQGEVARLERAVERLDRATSTVLAARGRLESNVETQLLALMGELSMGLVAEAAGRAERLADRLIARGSAGG